MKINIALIILFSQIHFMGVSAQKVTYIHFIHGPLMGNKENDYVAIEMSSKSKDIIFYEAGEKRRRKPQNPYSRYFYTLLKMRKERSNMVGCHWIICYMSSLQMEQIEIF